MIRLISFVLGAGTAVILSCYDKKKEVMAKGGKVGAIIDAAKLEKELFKDYNSLFKKWTSKEKIQDLKSVKKSALKEYGKDLANIQIDNFKRKGKFLRDNPELLL